MATFQQVYEEYGRPVYRFLLSLTGSGQEAEELLQETFYQAFLHIDRFEGRCSLYTWLCQIGKNAWLKECRRRKRSSALDWEQLELVEPSGSVEEQVMRREEYRQVRRAVLLLEDPYREVFIMHIFGGVPLKEIAAAHDRSESWARVTLLRARKKIAEACDGKEG